MDSILHRSIPHRLEQRIPKSRPGAQTMNLVKWLAMDLQETILILQNDWEITAHHTRPYHIKIQTGETA